jgi:hypothetical protein
MEKMNVEDVRLLREYGIYPDDLDTGGDQILTLFMWTEITSTGGEIVWTAEIGPDVAGIISDAETLEIVRWDHSDDRAFMEHLLYLCAQRDLLPAGYWDCAQAEWWREIQSGAVPEIGSSARWEMIVTLASSKSAIYRAAKKLGVEAHLLNSTSGGYEFALSGSMSALRSYCHAHLGGSSPADFILTQVRAEEMI